MRNRIVCPVCNGECWSEEFSNAEPTNKYAAFFCSTIHKLFYVNYGLINLNDEESKQFGYIYQNTYDLLNVLKDKVDLGVRLRGAYKSHNLKGLEELNNKVIPLVIKELDAFKKSFRDRWYQENKSFGYEVMDGRLGFLKNRLLTTIELLDKYLSGKIEKIDELEEDILPYSKDIKDEDLWAWKWDLIVSPSEL